MADILKFMHCGCEYNFCSTKEPPFPEGIFGDGSDGNCTIIYDECTQGNVFIEAKEYNFCNFTVCPNVKLRFCGNGVPIIRVQNCFDNNGTIILRNPLICEDITIYEPNLKKNISITRNTYYNTALALANNSCMTIEGLSTTPAKGGGNGTATGGGDGGIAGGSGCGGCIGGEICTTGGTSSYLNAGGGGGGGQTTGENGFNACDGIGGKGGDGGYSCPNNPGPVACYTCIGGGGGGGFGYCQGGDGGSGYGYGCPYYTSFTGGGDGGNSIIGKGGNGGNAYQTANSCYGAKGGDGGSSYYGDGGCGGYGPTSGKGGSSIFGNAGDGGGYQLCFPNCCVGSVGGNSLYGNAGYGRQSSGFGLNLTRGCGTAYGGAYSIGLFAKDIHIGGCIEGRGGLGGTSRVTPGTTIYVVHNGNFCCNGYIYCNGTGSYGLYIYSAI